MYEPNHEPQEALTDDGYGGMMCTQEKQCKVSCSRTGCWYLSREPWEPFGSDGLIHVDHHVYHYDEESQTSHLSNVLPPFSIAIQ